MGGGTAIYPVSRHFKVTPTWDFRFNFLRFCNNHFRVTASMWGVSGKVWVFGLLPQNFFQFYPIAWIFYV